LIHAAQGWYITNTSNIRLKWRLSRSADVVKYEIWISYRKRGPYFIADIINERNISQYTLASMHAGKYYFVMTSVDKKGNRSLQSNEVQVGI